MRIAWGLIVAARWLVEINVHVPFLLLRRIPINVSVHVL